MASALVYLFLVGFPSIGVLAAWLVALRSLRAARASRVSTPEGEVPGAVMMFLVLPASLLLFSLSLLFLFAGRSYDTSLTAAFEFGAMAYGLPALLAGFGIAIVYHKGVGSGVGNRELFSQTFTTAAMPVTPAIFGLMISLLILGPVSHYAGEPQAIVDWAMRAAFYISMGGLGAPLGAFLAASAWDFKSRDAWIPALFRALPGEVVSIVSFILAFLSIRSS